MTLSQWSKARAHKDFEASLQTYQVGAHFEALKEPVLKAPSDSRYTHVVFNPIFVQVWVPHKRYSHISNEPPLPPAFSFLLAVL